MKSNNNGNHAKEKLIAIALKHLEKSKINPNNKMIISHFIQQLSAENLTKDRQAKYIYTTISLSRRLNDKDFSKITKDDVVKVVGDINNSDFSEWTKRDYRIIFKRLMKYVRENEGVSFLKHQYPPEVVWLDSTMKKSKKELPKELLTVEDVKKLSEGTLNLRDKAFILFLYESGARIGEVLNIKVKDIDFDQYGALVSLMGKTGARKIRVIASTPAISNWLKHHPVQGNKEAWLFCGLNHKTLGTQGEYRYFNKLLRVAKQRAGIIKPVNPHHFRHSRATDLANKLTEAQLCAYMGWRIGSREAATYVHLSGRDTDKAILALHGLVNKEEESDQFTPIVCPRCGIKNDPGARFCDSCSLPLDIQTALSIKEAGDEIDDYLTKILEDTDVKNLIRSKIKDMRNDMERNKI